MGEWNSVEKPSSLTAGYEAVQPGHKRSYTLSLVPVEIWGSFLELIVM